MMEDELCYPTRIKTPQGIVHIQQPDLDIVERLDSLLPMGLRVFGEPYKGARFGLVVKQGDQEMRFVKQQPPEVGEEESMSVWQANEILVGATLAQYLAHEHEGLFWPLTYIRSKPHGVEAGIAYTSRVYVPDVAPASSVETAYDNDFSPGFTRMMMDFIEALKMESQITGITLQPCIGLDVRSRSQLGRASFGFLVLDQEVVCLKTVLSEDDPTWTVLRANGIDTVLHFPAMPLALES